MLVRNMDFQLAATGRLIWEYPAHAPGWNTAARDWGRYGPEMLDQIHGVAPVAWEPGLRWIADILDGISADWFLIGSASLAVRGMDVRPGGIDVFYRWSRRVGAGPVPVAWVSSVRPRP